MPVCVERRSQHPTAKKEGPRNILRPMSTGRKMPFIAHETRSDLELATSILAPCVLRGCDICATDHGNRCAANYPIPWSAGAFASAPARVSRTVACVGRDLGGVGVAVGSGRCGAPAPVPGQERAGGRETSSRADAGAEGPTADHHLHRRPE